MSSSFQLSLYLSTKYSYRFTYPPDNNQTNNQANNNLREELELTQEEYKDWKPTWELLPMFNRIKLLAALSNDFSYIKETHTCREIAMAKGAFYNQWRFCMNMIYRQSYITLTYPEPVPVPFRDVVTSALLDPYAVNSHSLSIRCDLEDTRFGIGMSLSCWDKAWLSLLTYFAKYGEFMCELCMLTGYEQATLDQTVRAILDSWYGQVGFYTAYGLWLWANKNETAIHGSYNQFNGIHDAMNHFSALYEPDTLLQFIKQYNLGLDRVSRLFLNNHTARCEDAGLVIPSWYTLGRDNDSHLSESPEWNSYMGYDDEDDDEDDFYEGEDDYDFEEDW